MTPPPALPQDQEFPFPWISTPPPGERPFFLIRWAPSRERHNFSPLRLQTLPYFFIQPPALSQTRRLCAIQRLPSGNSSCRVIVPFLVQLFSGCFSLLFSTYRTNFFSLYDLAAPLRIADYLPFFLFHNLFPYSPILVEIVPLVKESPFSFLM